MTYRWPPTPAPTPTGPWCRVPGGAGGDRHADPGPGGRPLAGRRHRGRPVDPRARPGARVRQRQRAAGLRGGPGGLWATTTRSGPGVRLSDRGRRATRSTSSVGLAGSGIATIEVKGGGVTYDEGGWRIDAARVRHADRPGGAGAAGPLRPAVLPRPPAGLGAAPATGPALRRAAAPDARRDYYLPDLPRWMVLDRHDLGARCVPGCGRPSGAARRTTRRPPPPTSRWPGTCSTGARLAAEDAAAPARRALRGPCRPADRARRRPCSTHVRLLRRVEIRGGAGLGQDLAGGGEGAPPRRGRRAGRADLLQPGARHLPAPAGGDAAGRQSVPPTSAPSTRWAWRGVRRPGSDDDSDVLGDAGCRPRWPSSPAALPAHAALRLRRGGRGPGLRRRLVAAVLAGLRDRDRRRAVLLRRRGPADLRPAGTP